MHHLGITTSKGKPKLERGIFGFPKTKPILFSFKGELWPSDDSGDADFNADNGTSSIPSRSKHTPHPQSEEKKDSLLPHEGSSASSVSDSHSDSESKDKFQTTFEVVENNQTKECGPDAEPNGFCPGLVIVQKKKNLKRKRSGSEDNAEDYHHIKKKKKKKKKKKRLEKEDLDNDLMTGKPWRKKSRKNKENSESKKERKRKKKLKVEEPGAEDNAKQEADLEESFQEGLWGISMPTEALVKIFKIAIQQDGLYPFLPRVSRVCHLWHVASQDSSLWEKVDLSWGRVYHLEGYLARMVEEKMSRTKEISLAGWGSDLSENSIKNIASKCPQLISINLSHCTKISGDSVKLLANKCNHLSSIDLSGMTKAGPKAPSPVSTGCLKHLVSMCGARLTHLFLAENKVTGLTAVFNAISETCPRLEVLDISNLSTPTNAIVLPLEKLQHGCPHLRVLRLASTPIALATASLKVQAQAPGFPDLEELSIAVDTDSGGLSDSSLERLVKTSHKLKLLDIRGCRHITGSTLIRTPAWDIQHLHLSQSNVLRTTDLELILKKWSHSLQEVDLSWAVNEESINQGVLALATAENESVLQAINLCGSAVSYSTIKVLLKHCPAITTLNLQSCRGLPRGIKRLYMGEEVEELRKSIDDGHFEDASNDA